MRDATTMTPPPAVRGEEARLRWLPAVLTAVLPGLGHLAAGRIRLAAVFGLPLVLLGGFGAGLVLGPARDQLLGLAVDDRILLGLLGAQGVLLAWRLAALGSAVLDPRLPRPGPRDALPLALLVLVIAAPHAYAGYVTEVARESVDTVFVAGPGKGGAWHPTGTPRPTAVAGPGAASAAPASPAAPSPTPAADTSRVNVLLIGVDAGVGRTTYLTDTLIVASLDRVAGTVSLLSFPRDLVDVPLPGGRTFAPKINSLLAYARRYPGEFPGSTGDGHDVLMAALGELTGLQIDLYAQVNLGGFVAVVSTLGGIDVNVARSFCDPSYDEYGFTRGFAITAGRHHLDGNQALAYARVRKAAGESDFTRQARQQEVLSGIRDRVVKGGFLGDPVGFLEAMSQTVETNIPRSMVPELVEYARKVDRSRTYRSVVTGAGLVQASYDARGYILLGDLAAIRARADAIFPAAGTLPPDEYRAPEPVATRASGSGVSACLPAATPRPAPKPTPKTTPVASPTASVSTEPGGSPKPTNRASPGPTPTPASEVPTTAPAEATAAP